MKAVAYLRVSTEEQSLERQYDDIKKFAESKHLNLVEIFEDKISGSKTKTDERDGFIKMEKFINSNSSIKHILVLEISRLGRKNYDIQTVIEKYIQKGINIHIKDLGQSTLDENGQRDFKSDLIISMLGVMAANESRLLSDRIKSGKMARAKKNQVFGGKIIGYKKGENGTPIIDEEQAPMIKKIFELASQGLGMRNVSAMIETEFNKKIPIGTLSGIIRNSFHKGERRYNELVLEVPSIVTKELWQKANDSIDGRQKFGSRTKVNTNIIHGKINCGECGNVMHQKVIPQGRIDTFVCKNDDCRNAINRPWLFRMIRLAVEKHAQKTKDKQVREDYKLKITSNNALIKSNLNEIEKLNNRRIKARTMYIDEDDFSKDDFEKIRDEAVQGIEKIEKINNRLNEEVNSYENALNTDIEHFSQDLEIFKEEIKEIIHEVIIHKDEVHINIFGSRVYELYKPNSATLGWRAKRIAKGLPVKKEVLPLRHPIDDEDLEIMKNKELNNKD